MGEFQPPRLEGLNSGDVISFADMPELVAFEDLLGPLVDPLCDIALWQTRPKLGDMLRPTTFHGTIKDIILTAMYKPYDRLLDSRVRGWKMPKGQGTFQRTQPGSDEAIGRYLGFIFDAEAFSTSGGSKGRIEAELWYYALPLKISDRGYIGKNNKAEAIRRVVTKPRLDTERFVAGHDTSCAIGFRVLRAAMRSAISTPMSG